MFLGLARKLGLEDGGGLVGAVPGGWDTEQFGIRRIVGCGLLSREDR